MTEHKTKEVISGNTYDKYGTKNPIAKWLMKKFLNDLSIALNSLKFSSLLEIGCGEGYLLKSLEKDLQGIKIMATDLSPKIISQADYIIPEIPKMVCSAYDLPFKDNSWDMILACEVMEHVDNPRKLLTEARRVSAKHCIFTVPLEPWWRVANILRGKYLMKLGNTPGHIQHWGKTSFTNQVKETFQKIQYKRVGLWQMIIARSH